MTLMQNINKNLRFSTCVIWLRINCLYYVGRFTAQWEIFTVRREKSLAMPDVYFLNFKIKTKILKFKIIRRIVRKFPTIQYNRPTIVLFHETIPWSHAKEEIRKDENLNQLLHFSNLRTRKKTKCIGTFSNPNFKKIQHLKTLKS
jgi:hypothetical protein